MMTERIENALDQFVRPKLSEHQGNLEVVKFEDGVLEIKLLGKCSGCPSAKFTTEDMVEAELKKYIPELEKVILNNSVSEDLLDFAKKILNKKS
ncbi:NifU family protein [Sedimentibacter saalensis]|uniref:NifU family protein n=1 Tax=Sedimentibacter saalensis TaxID=130788 RepID=UPI00289FA57E|nr:NifU family protein [Sedimentibacter saalensis]